MNFEDKFREMLEERGMFPEQSEKVVSLAKKSEKIKDMEYRWSDDISGYPPMMVPVIWVFIRDVALKYIDENMPEAWFRELI